MAEFMSAGQLKRLAEHKYSATGTSITEPFLQPFWRWLVDQIPLWWAPNAITLMGLVINVVTTLVLIYYSPDARQAAPSWAFLLAAVGLFVYQTLDAIDGKQARRTKTATPLGELFDHGCDSMSIAFVTLGVCVALQLGEYPWFMFFEWFAAMFLFYSAHWQTFVSGTLKFGIFCMMAMTLVMAAFCFILDVRRGSCRHVRVDVTEAQLIVMLIHAVAGICGPGVWSVKLPMLGFELKFLVLCFSVFAAILASWMYFYIIFWVGGVGKNGATVAGTSVITPGIPIVGMILMALAVANKSPSGIFHNYPCLYLTSFGMVLSKITNRLVICHMTRSEMEWLDSVMVGPGLLFLNQYFNCIVPEYIVLWLCAIYCTLDMLRFSYHVCVQICDYLNIFCFKIVPPKEMTNNSHTKNNSINNEHNHPIKYNTRLREKQKAN